MANKALLESQSRRIESLLAVADGSMTLLRDPKSLKTCLSNERTRLIEEVEKLRTVLIRAQIRNGKRQFFSAFSSSSLPSASAVKKATLDEPKSDQPGSAAISPGKPGKVAKERKAKGEAKAKPQQPKPAPENLDVSRLDMRIGIIVEASKHPDADKLYLEKVDVGEEKIRTVISGLADHVPLDQMQKRVCIFLCNLKPAKMRGISSEAMVMCANKDGVVEIIKPPEGCKPGDRVVVPGYEGTPDTELNPKKKVWEQIAPDLATDSGGKAAYKGVPWTINGECCTSSLKNCQIK